ncbi:HAMP domain-containing sensor histidine kinase [Maricaulis sp.]|uniref:sensor histidine kinase n=1 Tax=Maricaulis sp. TaxID=1486257 RepID=UPI00261BB123|nr:HAMP domain-containing sensor histidine kinase [Maricaulis sp.]
MFQALFQISKTPMLLVSTSREMLVANTAFQRLVRRSDAELIGAKVDTVLDCPKLDVAFSDASAIGGWIPLRVQVHQEVGDVSLDAQICCLRRHGHTDTFCVTASPASRSRVAFRRLREELSDARAIAAAEMSERAQLTETNRRLREFAMRAAHDIRGPLAHISHALSLQRRTGDDAEKRAQLLGMAEQSARNLSDLVSNLLAYSETTSQVLETKPVALDGLVQELALTLGGDALEPGWLEAEGLATVMCDPTQVRMIFLNLIGNAVKYRHPGRPLRVVVEGRRSGPTYTASISDNGLGFSPDIAEQIFEPFVRGRSEETGSGIGLATCREFAHNHGWTLSAHGEQERGARFDIAIPVTSLVQ